MTLAERLNAYERLMRLDKPIGILLLAWPTLWGAVAVVRRRARQGRAVDLRPRCGSD